jgi:hypothetical protein
MERQDERQLLGSLVNFWTVFEGSYCGLSSPVQSKEHVLLLGKSQEVCSSALAGETFSLTRLTFLVRIR